MRTTEVGTVQASAVNLFWSGALRLPEPGHSHWVTPYDLEDLRAAFSRGGVPLDLEAKLMNLAKGDLTSRYIEKHCGTIIALLQATHEGSFREASPEELERLLLVLAYVRKDDDAIADYQANGFADDQQEVRRTASALDPILKEFKAWRLRNQVPGMWRNQG